MRYLLMKQGKVERKGHHLSSLVNEEKLSLSRPSLDSLKLNLEEHIYMLQKTNMTKLKETSKR